MITDILGNLPYILMLFYVFMAAFTDDNIKAIKYLLWAILFAIAQIAVDVNNYMGML